MRDSEGGRRDTFFFFLKVIDFDYNFYRDMAVDWDRFQEEPPIQVADTRAEAIPRIMRILLPVTPSPPLIFSFYSHRALSSHLLLYLFPVRLLQ